MADTGTASHPNGVEHEEKSGMKRLVIAWTADASGDVEKALSFIISGYVSRLQTIPDTGTAPTDDYDITWEDDQGKDFLLALGINRDTANTENKAIELTNGLPVPVYTPSSTFKVANAGNGGKGVAILYWK